MHLQELKEEEKKKVRCARSKRLTFKCFCTTYLWFRNKYFYCINHFSCLIPVNSTVVTLTVICYCYSDFHYYLCFYFIFTLFQLWQIIVFKRNLLIFPVPWTHYYISKSKKADICWVIFDQCLIMWVYNIYICYLSQLCTLKTIVLQFF